MSDAPKRIQLSRRKGYRKPEGAIVVARPTRWGNLYRVGKCDGGWEVWSWASLFGLYEPDKVKFDEDVFATRAEAAVRAVEMFVKDFGPGGEFEFTDEELAELRGHDLACWCPLLDDDGKPWPCHADALLVAASG